MTQIKPISTPNTDDGYHYQVMRRAIDLIDRAEDPMQLEQIAGEMGMSAAHFAQALSTISDAGSCQDVDARPVYDIGNSAFAGVIRDGQVARSVLAMGIDESG